MHKKRPEISLDEISQPFIWVSRYSHFFKLYISARLVSTAVSQQNLHMFHDIRGTKLPCPGAA